MRDIRKNKFNYILKYVGIIITIIILYIIMVKMNSFATTVTKIEGCVWKDENQDGLVGEDEMKISGLTVVLCDEDGNEISEAVATTDENGKYAIETSNKYSKYKIKVKNNTVTNIYKVSTSNSSKSQVNGNIDIIYAYPEGEEGKINEINGALEPYVRGRIVNEGKIAGKNNSSYERKNVYYTSESTNGKPFKANIENAVNSLLSSGLQQERAFLRYVAIINNDIRGEYSSESLKESRSGKFNFIIAMMNDLEQSKKDAVHEAYDAYANPIIEIDPNNYVEDVKNAVLATYGITDQNEPNNDPVEFSIIDDGVISDKIEGEVQAINISVTDSQGASEGTTIVPSGEIMGDTTKSIGVVGSGECTIKGNVREYIDDANSNNIKGVKVELFDENGYEVQLSDESGQLIDAVYSDKDGNYEIQGVDTASVVLNDDGTISTTNKKYTVQFTYGTEEQLKINPKYNGQDYQSKKDEGATTVITTGGGNTDQSEEIDDLQPPEVEEGEKVDIYLLLDCSGSMQWHQAALRETFLKISDEIFKVYGDNARVGFATFSGTARLEHLPYYVNKEIGLSNENDYRNAMDGALNNLIAGGPNYNHIGIDSAREWLFSEGRENSKKYIIVIGDGVAAEWPAKATEAYQNAKNAGINMFSILVGNANAISQYFDFIMGTLAGTDWYYTPELHQGELFGKVISQYVSGNRDFVNNRDDLTEDGTTWGNIGTAITYSRANASIAEDDVDRRSDVNSYTSTIGYDLRKQIKKCF